LIVPKKDFKWWLLHNNDMSIHLKIHVMVRVGGDGGVALMLSASHVASVLVPKSQSVNV